jgi:ssDNA-binding Zn-finger/Zn-ribbon topoisomerase 1
MPDPKVDDILASLFRRPDEPVVEDVTMDEPMLTRSIYPCERHDLVCAECGSLMKLRKSEKFDNPFYGCTRFPECKGSHGAHRDGRPLGTPANKATKLARIRAHRVFDLLWHQPGGRMSRPEAYAWMRRKMRLSEDQAHIGKFSEEQCTKLIEAVREKFPFVKTAWDRINEDPFDQVDVEPSDWEID